MENTGKYSLNKHTIRNSSIELLRIIVMALSVLHHFTVHGDIPMGTGSFYQDLYFQFTAFGGRVGVWCFVMITGDFSCIWSGASQAPSAENLGRVSCSAGKAGRIRELSADYGRT